MGSWMGVPIVSVLPPDTYEFNDNILFFPKSPEYFDSDGVSFVDQNGVDYNLYFFFVYNLLSTTGIDDNGELTVTSTSPVPERSTMLLLGTSLLGTAGVFRRHGGPDRWNRQLIRLSWFESSIPEPDIQLLAGGEERSGRIAG